MLRPPRARAAAFAPATTAEAIELVAAGVGLLVVPSHWPASTTAVTSPTDR